ncbi:hypothetical protein TRFO_09360 [Tritrichomonas foetus]|uniref:UDENN domain-containing protein n=1 Tax=Tritrichomonas foetus TaxID=1144522 RepID=A0A1J4JG49_9EUKA|nr:hypothetical protein TRFO_09360 [Tritrichomonas foetus]|eukprot:OHS97649.1 hypothetical protein TRFO_09360 [Tritrichomonas foetus]
MNTTARTRRVNSASPQVKVNYNLTNEHIFDAFFIFNRAPDLVAFYPENWFEVNKIEKEKFYYLVNPSNKYTPTSQYDFWQNAHVFAINGEEIPIYGVSCELSMAMAPYLTCLFANPVHNFRSLDFVFISKAPYINTLFRLIEICAQVASGFLVFPSKEVYNRKYSANLSPPVYDFISRIYNMDYNEFINFSKLHNFKMHHMLTGSHNSIGRRNFMFCASSFGHPGFEILFSCLTPKDIVNLYSALLLEDKMIVIGDNMFKITNVIMCLLFMISPFKPCVPLSPILPDIEHTQDLFGSPTPFIAGFYGTLPGMDEYTSIINLSTGKLDRAINSTNIPNASKVAQSLSELINNPEYIVPKDPEAKKEFWNEMRDEYLDVCEYEISLDLKYCFKPLVIPKIQKILHEEVDFCYSIPKLRVCFDKVEAVKNEVKIIKHKFNEKLFLEHYANGENTEFARAIVATQCFNDFYHSIEDDWNE